MKFINFYINSLRNHLSSYFYKYKHKPLFHFSSQLITRLLKFLILVKFWGMKVSEIVSERDSTKNRKCNFKIYESYFCASFQSPVLQKLSRASTNQSSKFQFFKLASFFVTIQLIIPFRIKSITLSYLMKFF